MKQLYRGQIVTIDYDADFARDYPFTFAMWNGKTGIVVEFIQDQGDGIVSLSVGLEKSSTLVDRRHIYEAKT